MSLNNNVESKEREVGNMEYNNHTEKLNAKVQVAQKYLQDNQHTKPASAQIFGFKSIFTVQNSVGAQGDDLQHIKGARSSKKVVNATGLFQVSGVVEGELVEDSSSDGENSDLVVLSKERGFDFELEKKNMMAKRKLTAPNNSQQPKRASTRLG